MAESRWAGTLSDVKITHFLGSIFFLARGHMYVVKSQPCWPHTWRYAPSPFPTDTFFTDSPNFSNFFFSRMRLHFSAK